LLHWLPAAAQVHSMSIPLSGYPAFTYDPANHVPGVTAIDPTGQATIDIRPTALTTQEIETDLIAEKASSLSFVAFYNDDFASTDIELHHDNTYYTTVSGISDFYLLYVYATNPTLSFTVQSSSRWEIQVSDPHEILSDASRTALNGKQGGNNTAGETISFTMGNRDIAKDNKSATLTFHDLLDRVDEIHVQIRGIACGVGNENFYKTIGNNSYLTHAFGSGTTQRCWMVENSIEGTSYSGNAFGRDQNGKAISNWPIYPADAAGLKNGYYYTYAQAKMDNNACPTGWRLPTNAEINAMVPQLNASSNLYYWWKKKENNAFAGNLYTGTHSSANSWQHWGTNGGWWGNETLMIRSSGTVDAPSVTGATGNYWLSVRCVQK
jgi:uncharacterized protein (TIGR02145 family)